MEFLSGPETAERLNALIKRSAQICAAVAYWGEGAVNRLGIGQRGLVDPIRIICDLRSGACNPREMQKLLASGADLRTIDGMHAKVWCFEDCTVVGSSNASANGMGLEGQEITGNLEANLLSSDKGLVGCVHEWFDEQWRRAIPVSEEDILKLQPLWEVRRARIEATTCASVPDRVKGLRGLLTIGNVILTAGVGTNSKEAESFYLENLRDSYGGKANENEKTLGRRRLLPIYEYGEGDEIPQQGTKFIEFIFLKARGTPYFAQIWEVRKHDPIHYGNGELIVLLNHVDNVEISTEEQLWLGNLVKDYVSRNDLWNKEDPLLHMPLSDFFREVDAQLPG